MKKEIFYLLLWCRMVVPMAFGETPLEWLKVHAEADDASAQTLLGMMYQAGYQVPKDLKQAEQWFARGYQGGDEFAGTQLRTVIRESEALKGKPKGVAPALPKPTLADRIARAADLEYGGKVSLEDLRIIRSNYLNKVVVVSFFWTSLPVPTAEHYITVCDDDRSLSERITYDHTVPGAAEWAIMQAKDENGSWSSVYVLVESNGLLGLGIRRKRDNGASYNYSW